MEKENKINVVVPENYNGTPIEIVLREGKASEELDPKEPERVVINGTIDAPFRWLEKRVELINQKSANIIVNRDKMGLALTIDETNYYQTEISGILQASKEMQEFGINTDKKWEPIKLSQFFKMHRAFFKDKSENMMLVSTLKNFKAKVNQDIERSKEENGSKVDNYSQVVDSNLPKSFKLNVPLFKGFANEEIEVEIYADVDGRDVSLSLVSAGANETIEEYKNKVIDEQIEEAARQMARRLMSAPHGEYKKEDLMLIREEDIVTPVAGDPEKPLEALNAMVGLSQLKRSIVQHLNYVYFIRERQKQGFSDVLPPLNMIFMGNPGTGKTTVVKMMGEIYRAAGILSRQDVLIQDARSLMAETNIPPAQLAESLLDAAAGGILYLSYADALAQTDYGLALFEELLAGMPDDECGGTLVVLGGYPDRMQQLLKAYPSLSTYFPYVFHFNDYTPEELLRIAENRLERKHYLLQPKAREALAGLIRKACENRDRNFGNALLVEKIVEMLIHNMSDRTMRIRRGGTLTRQDLSTVREEDVPAELFPLSHLLQAAFDEKEISAALEDLKRLVGQPGIKKQINDFVELARHYNAEGTKLSSKMSLQWCFTGNSGMGKGTVARIIARLYQAMGIISTGQVWPFKVERMVGLTEEEAQRSVGEALMRAEGGILLFDEDSPKLEKAAGLRERVRAILMNQLAERPGSQIIIYATPRGRAAGLNGGAEQMSEVVNLLVFEDYTREELMDILKRRLQKENMKMTTTARQYMNDFLATLVATEERSHASSRVMRIVADMIVRNCLQRSAKGSRKGKAGSVLSVQKQDVSMFDEQFVAGIMKERKRIGFV